MIAGNITVIKGITADCAPLIYEWVNQEDLRALTGTLYPVSQFEHQEWIKNVALAKDKKTFLICEKEHGKPIGTIGLKNIDNRSRNAELFISIGDKAFLSNGYGTDAINALCNFCFNSLNLHKVYVHVYASNPRAIRCYEKVGFQKEGCLLQHHFNNGAYEDVWVMGKLCSTKEKEYK